MVETAHRMHVQPNRVGLDREQGKRGPGVMHRVMVVLPVVGEGLLGRRDYQNPGTLGPLLILRNQDVQKSLELFGAVLGRNNKTPRLLVEA